MRVNNHHDDTNATRAEMKRKAYWTCLDWHDGEESALYRLAFETGVEPSASAVLKEVNTILATEDPNFPDMAVSKHKAALINLRDLALMELKQEKVGKLIKQAAKLAQELDMRWYQFHDLVTNNSEGFRS